MPRRSGTSSEAGTTLSRFLAEVLKKEKLTIRQAAAVAEVGPSVFGSWVKGASPSLDSLAALRRFCTKYHLSLSVALTGEPDVTAGTEGVEALFHENEIFDGYARITIHRLVPKKEMKKKESA